MTKTPEYLFVYGTLTRDHENPMANLLHDHAMHLGPAEFSGGQLYRISWYPGLVETGDPGAIVHGELYEFSSEISDVMRQLDVYEGIGPDFPQPQEYRRERRVVQCNGQGFAAWVYLYEWAVDSATLLADGRFVS